MMLDLCHMTRMEFAEAMAAERWLIIPLGATEEHGPHLPLGSDTIQAQHVARAVARELDGLVAPGLPYGLCRSTRNFPGTISLSLGALEALVREILVEYVRQGARKILMLSGQGGGAHLEAVRQAALHAVERDERVTVAVIGPTDIRLSLPEVSALPSADAHAGALETSVMLAIDATLVRTDRMVPVSRPCFPPGQVLRYPERFFPAGVMGDPCGASGELGRRVLDRFAAEVVKLLKGFARGG